MPAGNPAGYKIYGDPSSGIKKKRKLKKMEPMRGTRKQKVHPRLKRMK